VYEQCERLLAIPNKRRRIKKPRAKAVNRPIPDSQSVQSGDDPGR
jgi:hypothetical protein